MVGQFEYVEAVKVGGDLLARVVVEIQRPLLVASNSNVHKIAIRLHHYFKKRSNAENIDD
jgi:hypothetical protein